MAKFSEIYVESNGKLYKFEDAELMVAEDGCSEAPEVTAQLQSAAIQDAQELQAQTVGVAQVPAVEETAQVAQIPVAAPVVQDNASSNAAASAAQMVAESVIAPVATAETAVPAAEGATEEEGKEKQTVQEQFNELYESLI